VVEYVQRLNARFKVKNGTRKWLHRQVCKNYLSPRIRKRKKRGFAVNVVDDWFRSSLDSDLPRLLLDETSLMFELLKPQSVRNLLEMHRSGRQDNHKLLFSIIMFEYWLRGIHSKQKEFTPTSAIELSTA
jgi:asparagine synthase (glutamine-hydrolysing)